MEQFLELFGDMSIGWAVAVIAAGIFLVGCYKKFSAYISEKAIREKEKDGQIQEVIEQAKKYPEWHKQSKDIQKEFNGALKDLGSKLDAQNKILQELKIKSGENAATTCRYRILRFDDEIRHETKHSKEHFDQVFEDINEYEKYCREHEEYKNNKAVLAIENIKRVYQNCANEGTFL